MTLIFLSRAIYRIHVVFFAERPDGETVDWSSDRFVDVCCLLEYQGGVL